MTEWLTMRLQLILREQLTYLEICKFLMTFYDIVADYNWTVDLISDLKTRNDLR